MHLFLGDSGCDNCNEWFHGHCINITEKMAKAIQEWYCMRCRGDNNFFFFCLKKKKNHSGSLFAWKLTRFLLFLYLFLYLWSPEENPLLEVKYRSKKNRDKEPDSDRGERQYSTPSTPDYRSERRRGSKVSCIIVVIISRDGFATCMTGVGWSSS